MKKIASVLVVILAVSGTTFASLIGIDDSGNYGGGWTTGTNQGTGFGAWTLAPSGNAGTFIGDPTAAGISGLGTSAFGLYANTTAGDFVDVTRSFSSALLAGDTFSIDWGVNWDSAGTGNKGLNLMAGATELININMGGSQTNTINGSAMFTNYGVNAMTINFQYLGDTSVRVYATGRDGLETYDQTLVVSSGTPTGFKIYASGLAVGDQRQPYFDNLAINSIPEPATMAMLGLGAGLLALRRFRKK
ncbi:MAG: PEP-CTERM sorting domain-containing protein [Lentisphaerota bacterium]